MCNMRRAANIDKNQTVIVNALRHLGVAVEIISKPLDLLIWHKGHYSLMEIKNRDGFNRLTKPQVEFIARWPGKIHVVHDEREAIEAVLGKELLR